MRVILTIIALVFANHANADAIEINCKEVDYKFLAVDKPQFFLWGSDYSIQIFSKDLLQISANVEGKEYLDKYFSDGSVQVFTNGNFDDEYSLPKGSCKFIYHEDRLVDDTSAGVAPTLEAFLSCSKKQQAQSRLVCYDKVAGFEVEGPSGYLDCWRKESLEQVIWMIFADGFITNFGGSEMEGRSNFAGAEVWLDGVQNTTLNIRNPKLSKLDAIIKIDMATKETRTLGDNWFSCDATLY